MPVTVSGNVSVSLTGTDQRTAIAGAANETGTRQVAVSGAWAIATGLTAGLADKIWSDTRTLAGGATAAIDFAAVMTNAFGSIETFVTVRAIVIVASAANTSTLTIQRPAAATGLPLFAAISDALAPLSAGGGFAWFDPAVGITVVAGTADILNVVNSAGPSATFSIAVAGTSA
jgi:hypothetical protein